MTLYWQNWARTVKSIPAGFVNVCCEADIIAAIHEAKRQALRIKVVGSGHSYNDIADSSGAICASMSSYAAIEHVDRNTNRVTVQAGMQLGTFCEALASLDLALPVLGAITDQTVAGIISTATHGTGRSIRSLSDYVVGLRLVDGNGNAVDISVEQNADLLNAARVGLGSLGIISTVTFACVPGFNLVLETRPMKLRDVIANLKTLYQADYFGFWWIPQTRWTMLRTASRKPLDNSQPCCTQERDHIALRDVLHETALWLAGNSPRTTSLVNAAEHALRFRHPRVIEGRWDKVFPCPSPIRQVAMEYAIPIESTGPVLEALEGIFLRHAMHAPVDVRFCAADESWLSPANQREVCYVGIGVSKPFGRHISYEALFGDLEAVFCRFGGRPHWGKIHTLNAEQLRALYPQWHRFAEVRNMLDPNRIFVNSYLSSKLGD